MVYLIIIILAIAVSGEAIDKHVANKKRAQRAIRTQARIIEARKGYKNLGPNKPTDHSY